MLLAIAGASRTLAATITETVSDYLMDFNTSFAGYAPGPGWARIEDHYSYGSTISYAYDATYGVDGSGCIAITNQDSGSYYDLLVTPKVSGVITMQVKRKSYSTDIKFYTVSEAADGTLSRGEEITAQCDNPMGSSSSYQKYVEYTVTLSSATRIGIRGSGVYIDDFQADQAIVDYQRTLKVDEATLVGEADADADGNVSLTLNAKLVNNGDLTLNPGDEGYSISIINKSDNNAVLATLPISQSLAPGESTTVQITATFPISTYPGNNQYSVMENIDGTSPYGTWVQPTSYEAVFSIYLQGSEEAMKAGEEMSFGVSNSDVTKYLTVKNPGAAVLTVTSVTLPDGFSTSITAPFNVDAHGEQNVDLTMLSTNTPGNYSGDVVFAYSDGETFAIKVSGTVLDPAKWYAPFDDGNMPQNIYQSGWKVANSNSSLRATNGYYMESSASSSVFISPLLRAEAGESLQMDIAKYSSNGELRIYYSTDRKNKTLLKTVAADDIEETFATTTINMPQAGDFYIHVEGSAYVDNIYGLKAVDVERDIIITNETLPDKGEVNNAVTASATLLNIMDATVEAGSYTAVYYVDGKAVAQANASDLEKGKAQTFTFQYMPHEAGEFDSYVEIEFSDGERLRTSTVAITIAEETAKGETVVGTSTNWGTQQPLYLYNSKSESEVVYTAQELGITQGTKIKKIVYKGYSKVSGSAPVRVWLENTADSSPKMTQEAMDVTGMTEVFNSDVAIAEGGDRSEEEQVDVLTVTLDEPFEYTGGNLRVYVNSEAETGIGGQVYFAYSSIKNGKRRYKNNSDPLAGTYPSNVQGNPVMGLVYDKETSLFSGILSIDCQDGTNQILPGTRVTLTADDGVMYEGVTDNDGKYSIAVMQDTKTYNISVGYDEKNIFPIDTKAVFKGTTLNQNITLVEAVDFYINSFTPESATLTANNRYTEASVTATNYNAVAMEAGSYTVKLFLGDKEVATAEAVEIGAKETKTYTFAFTPHETGSFKAHYELTGTVKPIPVRSDDFDVVVKAESTGGEVQVLDANDMSGYSGRAPFELNYKHSMSETVYTADKLGLQPGAAITSLAFKSYRTGTKEIDTNIKVWIENTTDGLDYTPGRNPQEMTKVYEGTVTVKAHGSSDSPEKFFTFDMSDDPFVYSGGNIRVVALADASDYSSTYFERDANYSGSYVKQSDSANDAMSISWDNTKRYSPVMYLTVDASKHYAGIVVNKANSPVAGAVVTLTNADNDVVYSAVSADDGSFDIVVAQHTLPYMVTASKGTLNYSAEEAVEFGGNDITSQTITLSGSLRGDVNCDGEVSLLDITCMVDYVLGDTSEVLDFEAGDLNDDSELSISDIMAVVSIVLKLQDHEGE